MVDNSDMKADFSTKQRDETAEDSSECVTAKNSEERGEIAVEIGKENGIDADKHFEENAIDEENEDVGNENITESNDEEVVEIVEIEEKVAIETVDEAEADKKQVSAGEDLNVTVDLSSIGIISKSSTFSETNSEQDEPIDVKQQELWTDLLGNGLLKKKVSFSYILFPIMDMLCQRSLMSRKK